jgi:hypothetical protein
VRLSEVSPLAVAINSKAFGVVKYLIEKFQGQGLREYFHYGKWSVEGPKGKAYSFTNVILPLILRQKDQDALTFLLKQNCFSLST